MPGRATNAALRRALKASRLRRRLRLLWKTLVALLALGTVLSAVLSILATVELTRHLGRLLFAMPLAVHMLLDSVVALMPLLCARSDGESVPPPPKPRTQVEFQRQLRAGQPLYRARVGAEGWGWDEAYRFRVSRGIAAALVLVYVVADVVALGNTSAGFLGMAWAFTVEADGEVCAEWRGMHAALTVLAGLAGVAAVVRGLTVLAAAAYLWVSLGSPASLVPCASDVWHVSARLPTGLVGQPGRPGGQWRRCQTRSLLGGTHGGNGCFLGPLSSSFSPCVLFAPFPFALRSRSPWTLPPVSVSRLPPCLCHPGWGAVWMPAAVSTPPCLCACASYASHPTTA